MSDPLHTDGPGVTARSHTLTPGTRVELFIIDLTPLGSPVPPFAFTTRGMKGQPVFFRGQQYTPLDVEATGFELSGRGALPQPVIRIAAANRIISSAAVLYDDLIGARLLRTVTFAEYLDNGSSPDPNEAFATDIYAFEQKTSHNKRQIEWKLAAAMDQEGRKLPGRLILRDLCLFRYRRFNGAAFDYTHTVCPYGDNRYFDADGNQVSDPAADRPSRKLSTCCKPRFPGGPYPFGGFPGVERIKT